MNTVLSLPPTQLKGVNVFVDSYGSFTESTKPATGTCTACDNPVVNTAIMQAFAYYTNPVALANILTTTTCKTSSCLINALSPLINDLAEDVTINMITAFTQSYATNVLSLSAADLQEVNAFIASYAALSAKLLELQNRKRTTLPVSTAVVLSSAVIGQRLIASDLPFYIDERNRGPLGESIAQNLKGYGNIESVNASSVRVSPSFL